MVTKVESEDDMLALEVDIHHRLLSYYLFSFLYRVTREIAKLRVLLFFLFLYDDKLLKRVTMEVNKLFCSTGFYMFGL